MAKFKNKQSQNVQDYRNPAANMAYSKFRDSPEGKAHSVLTQTVTSQAGPSVRSRQNAKALGIEGNLADLQNAANKLEARRRTRLDSVYRGMLK